MQEVTADVYRLSNYCPGCGTFLEKVYVETIPGPHIVKTKLKPEDVHVDALWDDYLEKPIILFNSSVYAIQWANKKRLAYKEYREKFSPNNLLDVDCVKRNFHDWLRFENNCSWTTYQRKGTRALEEPEKLAQLLFTLQNEDLDVTYRVRVGLEGDNKVNGIGQSILTSLLHTFNDKKYGVCNSKTAKTLKKLQRPPEVSDDIGQSYAKVNNTLNVLAKELETDLVMLDGFMWFVTEYYDF